MPKKRHHHHHLKPIKPSSTASPASGPASTSAANKPPKSVNELLANLRLASTDPSASRRQHLSTVVSPSVPPALREILQIPETPAPAPRRAVRQRVDNNGRRLPAGPPPPRSWLTARTGDASRRSGSSPSSLANWSSLVGTALPGTSMPARGSLIDVVLRRLGADWEFHQVYHQYHLYFVPGHLKAALIRWISVTSSAGVSLPDLKLILLPPLDVYGGDDDDDLGPDVIPNAEVSYLDLSGSLGRSITVKEVSELLYPSRKTDVSDELQDSWDAVEFVPSHPRVLLPNLTHLSLALNPQHASDVSWKQLLLMSSKLSSITHLSLAYWPDPCLTPRARFSTVTTSQGQNVPYGGTNYYSHTIDHDWSEALLVLRMLSKNLYALEFLDLTGCSPWFKALVAQSGHDFVDWAGFWGKITLLRLYVGWAPGDEALPSERTAYREAVEMAGSVEKHVRAMRAGKGRFITVERDKLDS